MKLGVIISLSDEIEAEFAHLAGLGFPSCQLNCWDATKFTAENIRRVTEASRASGVEISALWCGWSGPTVWDLVDGPLTLGLVPTAYRFERLQQLLAGADFASALGVKDIITHVGFIPENPNNPEYPGVIAALRYLAGYCRSRGLAELAAERWDDGDAFFPPTTFQVSNVRAGTGATNVIPGSCEVDFNLRFAPVSSADSLRERIEAMLRRHGLEYDLTWTVGAQPFSTAEGPLSAAMAAAIRAVTGRTTQLSTTGGTSDGRFLATICRQVVEFGPPNASIHKIDEHIAVADLEPLKNIYRGTLERLLT